MQRPPQPNLRQSSSTPLAAKRCLHVCLWCLVVGKVCAAPRLRARAASADGVHHLSLHAAEDARLEIRKEPTVGELLIMAARLRGRIDKLSTSLRKAQVKMMSLQAVVGGFALNLTMASRNLTATNLQAELTRKNVDEMQEKHDSMNHSFTDLDNVTGTVEKSVGNLTVAKHVSPLLKRLDELETSLASADSASALAAMKYQFMAFHKVVTSFNETVVQMMNRTFTAEMPLFEEEQRRLFTKLQRNSGGLDGKIDMPTVRC